LSPAPGFLVCQIQSKFCEAAKEKDSGPQNHEQTGLIVSLGSNCSLIRRRLSSASGMGRLRENEIQ
jgi:hypothetical protein